MNQQRTAYPSDLSDKKWEKISPMISSQKVRGRNRSTDMREIVNGINYRWNTECVWRMLPHDFPPWETVYFYFKQWKNNGTLLKIRETMISRNSVNFQQENRSVCNKKNDEVEHHSVGFTEGESRITKGKNHSWKSSRYKNNFPAESSRSA
jgi:transposase